LTVTVNAGQEVWLRWLDTNDASNDHGLAIDDFSVTPQGVVGQPALSINDLSLNEGDASTTTFTFTVSLSAPAAAGGVTFDIATADGPAGQATQPSDYTQNTLTSQTIPAGNSTYTFDVLVNGDTTFEPNETFFVNVTNVSGAIASDGQGRGTITNDDAPPLTFIHDVQGSGPASPLAGATAAVEGIVVANFQGTTKLQGFFLQEEDTDADANPATSEGIFVFCGGCPTAIAEGQRVRVTGVVSEFFNMTEITASTAGSVVVTNAGNSLALVTPSPIDLPIAGSVDDFYEAREGMKVTFVDSLTVSEYFELGRFGQIVLYEGGRPRQFTEANAPSVAGNAANADTLSRRRVILDDENNAQESYLSTSSPPGPPDGQQSVYYPRANGGFSVGSQGTDFFRGGDLVNGLTGVLQWSFPGLGANTWRIRPTAANPASFTVANPRPATPPEVGGAIKAVGMNLLNYFTTIDTTSSNSTGPCAPGGTLDCRGADSVAELARQRERASVVICAINADVYGFAELENTTAGDAITDLLGAVNARCGGAHPYQYVNTGGTLGTDAIRVQQIYRTGIVSPVGSPLVDLDPVHNRPPTAQTFDVVDAANTAFGQRFTVIVNHFKSKGCPGTGADADAGDGQGCFNGARTAQATRLLTWINSTVVPAAGDPDVLLLGDFNAYAKEDPITTLQAGGFNDLETTFHGANAYSYLFDGQLGHLDYGLASASLLGQVTGADAWHINADEVELFDYNDELRDSPGESTFEEKPDGSALVPPRVVFQPGSPYRASDHDPVIVGLFPAQATLTVTGPASLTFGTTDTATATGGSGSGAVTFSATGSTGCAVVGTTVSVSDASGTCSLTAAKAGDGTYGATTSAPFAVTLIKASQTIVFTSTPPASPTVGGTYVMAATGGASSNAVTFSSLTPGACTVSGSTASFIATGSCQVAADQLGNNNYAAAAQSTQSMMVAAGLAATTTTLGSNINPANVGQSVTFTATVKRASDNSAVTSGTVTFKEGALVLAGPTPVNGSGQANFTSSSLTVGSHTVTAFYNGTTTFATSFGNVVEVVNLRSTDTELFSINNPSEFSDTVFFTAWVHRGLFPVGNGTVTFRDGTAVLAANVALNGLGLASFSTSSLGVGSHAISATF
ncbi:MAG: ExeM/NucH family extracellular endonuclease, partial [Vicinamibacterales bacterium]